MLEVQSIWELCFILVSCHLVGDYVFQSDFIAKTKGENIYHLFVHSALYVVPFYIAFGWDYFIIPFLFSTHVLIDAGKARYHVVSYLWDQVFHFAVLVPLYLVPYILNN